MKILKNNIKKNHQRKTKKNIKEEKEKIAAVEEKVDEKLNLQEIEEKEKVIEKVQESKPDVFDVKKKEPVYTPPKKSS